MNLKITVLLIVVLLAVSAQAADPLSKLNTESESDRLEFFEKRVRPLLVEACYSCHSRTAERLEGGLYLDSRTGLLKGGDSGPAVEPGQPDASLLIEAIRYESYEMPPSGKLPPKQIEDLTRWVEMGATWPSEDASAEVPEAATFDWQERKRQHWSWQPIADVQSPEVNDTSWPRNAIDRFILARLEASELKPAPVADRRTQVRRLYFDLIGLPPTTAQVQDFLNDQRPDAYDRQVDQLLASEHFGEKWARHWMDLVRFAETYGHEFDYPIHHAYRYRDYLIRAWNADVPYDQFITEHLAGDLLNEPRRHPTDGFNESIIGTGFWFLGEAVHAPTDVRGDEAIRIDNQIDVMSKAMLGLTVACARCHDHKFDPISAADYYALAGFLQSSCRQEAMLDVGGQIGDAADQIRVTRREAGEKLVLGVTNAPLDGPLFSDRLLAARLATAADIVDASSSSTVEADATVLDRWNDALADPALAKPTHPLHVWSQLAVKEQASSEQPSSEQPSSEQPSSEQPSSEQPSSEQPSSEQPSSEQPSSEQPSSEQPSSEQPFVADRERLSSQLEKAQQRALRAMEQLVVFEDFDGEDLGAWRITGEAFDARPTTAAQWDGNERGDTFTRPGVAHGGLSSERLRGALRSPTFTITHPKIHYRLNARDVQLRLIIDGYFMDVFNGLLFRDATVKSLDTEGEFRWHTQAGDIKNHIGRTARIEIIDSGDGFAAVDEICFSDGGAPSDAPCPIGLEIAADTDVTSIDQLAAAYGRAWDLAVRALQSRSADAAQTELLNWALQHSLVAQEAMTASCAEKITEIEAGIVAPIPVLAITDGTGEDESIHIRGSHKNLGEIVPRRLLTAIAGPMQTPIAEGSGRLELARRVTDSSNPFPARVVVNRLWHHLFGRGLVPSVDDFGKMGQPPTHPQLLDWLASDFTRQGWSLKRAIRQMVLSSTYRMSSRSASGQRRADATDPANELFHRMPIRRLQAEAIRDAMLVVSGRFDDTMYGPSVPVHLTSFMEGRGRPSSGPQDGNGRRSVYVEIRRNFLSPMMLAFDTPSPFSTMGRRSASNVPAQSLILMNDPFVIAQARLWAEHVAAESEPGDERITAIFQAALARPPSDRQRDRSKRFLQQQADLYGAQPDDLRVWADLCHAVLNMKEFIYLD